VPATEGSWYGSLVLHGLRHTAAALMISEGANALQVKRRMGHEDIRSTYNVYGLSWSASGAR
jgi:integrase